jgi:hypothetical protein
MAIDPNKKPPISSAAEESNARSSSPTPQEKDELTDIEDIALEVFEVNTKEQPSPKGEINAKPAQDPKTQEVIQARPENPLNAPGNEVFDEAEALGNYLAARRAKIESDNKQTRAPELVDVDLNVSSEKLPSIVAVDDKSLGKFFSQDDVETIKGLLNKAVQAAIKENKTVGNKTVGIALNVIHNTTNTKRQILIIPVIENKTLIGCRILPSANPAVDNLPRNYEITEE